jgi:hypothetical protein
MEAEEARAVVVENFDNILIVIEFIAWGMHHNGFHDHDAHTPTAHA